MTQGRSSMLRSSLVMASGTLLSRILGFIRAALLISAIGAAAGGVNAAFQTANTLPNMVFNLLATGLFDAILIPQIVRALKRDDQTYVNRLLTATGLILFLVTVVALIAAPLLVIVTAAGYDAQIRSLAIAFALVCLPQIFFYGLYNLLGELLAAWKVFAPYTWAPVVNNVVGIAGLVAFLVMWGSSPQTFAVDDLTSAQFWVLAGTATLGVASQAAVLVIPMRRAGIPLRPDWHFRGTSFGSASRVAMWSFAALGATQVGILSTSNIAAQADAWARTQGEVIVGINAYSTAFMMFMVPQSLIAGPLVTILFTRISASAAERDHAGVARDYELGVRSTTFLLMLTSAALIAAAVPAMQILLPSVTDGSIVTGYAWILRLLLPSAIFSSMAVISQRIFFAYEDARPVFFLSLVPTVIQVVLGWSLYALLAPAHWVMGATLAETVARLAQGCLALAWVAKRNGHVRLGLLARTVMVSALAAIAACAVTLAVLAPLGALSEAPSTAGRFGGALLRLAIAGAVASVVYLLVMRFLAPADTARAAALVLDRLPVPGPVRRFLLAGAVSAPTSGRDADAGGHPHNGGDGTGETRSSMDEQEHTPDEAALPTHSSATGGSSDAPAHDGDSPEHPSDSPAAEETSGLAEFTGSARERTRKALEAGRDALSTWSQRVAGKMRTQTSSGAAPSDPVTSSAWTEADSVLPSALSEVLPAEQAAGTSAAGATAATSVGAAVAAATDGDGEVDARGPAEVSAQPVNHPAKPQWKQVLTPPATLAQSGRLDPTPIALVLAALLVVVTGAWAVHTAFAPAGGHELAERFMEGTAQTVAQSGEEGQSDAAQSVPGPVVTGARVMSWRDDDGDNPDQAGALIDQDPATQWSSRVYDLPMFPKNQTIALVLSFEAPAEVHSVTVTMDPATTGGNIVLRNVDSDNPRQGTELGQQQMGPTVTFTLDKPVTTGSIALTIHQMATTNGELVARIGNITVE